MFPSDLIARAAALVAHCAASGLTVTTAESCTGGLLAALLTEIPGSSAVLKRGLVTYANEAKEDLLGVSGLLLATQGAVSSACALAMAEGALARAGADVAVSITGIAGPGGGSPSKPVGLVYFALAQRGRDAVAHERRFGDQGRVVVRREAMTEALSLLEQACAG